jgi:hypothetical protein
MIGDRIPHLPYGILPEADKEGAWILQRNLEGLSDFKNRVIAALQLSSYCERELAPIFSAMRQAMRDLDSTGFEDAVRTARPLQGWEAMAVRDAAMSIFHFGRCFEAIRSQPKINCQSIFAALEADKIKEARKLFEAAFPHWIRFRDAVAHEAERSTTANKEREHSADLEGGSLRGLMVRGPVRDLTVRISGGSNLTLNWGGNVLGFHLDDHTVNTITTITGLIFSGIQTACNAVRDDHLAQNQQAGRV